MTLQVYATRTNQTQQGLDDIIHVVNKVNFVVMRDRIKNNARILGLFCLLVVLSMNSVYASDELNRIHLEIEQEFDVDHIHNVTLKSMLANDNVVLFDVREAQEHAVSHIDKAIQVDPDISLRDFFELHESKLKDRIVIFYCSVGVRSSKLLDEFSDEIFRAGAEEAYNLEGGAFKWHNDNIELMNEGQVTRSIHPYNRYWGRLIVDSDSIKYR